MGNGNVIASVLTPEDLDLDTPLWINYAYREEGSLAGRIQGHVPANRFITDVRVNPLLDNQTALQVRPSRFLVMHRAISDLTPYQKTQNFVTPAL